MFSNGEFMVYEEFPFVEFFSKVATETQVIEMAWKYKTEALGYRCRQMS
jgi:hypothetical protein